ncbi:MAG: hypothetical protein IID32_07800 [Planctomycetes bacterium]|nr:hypothetical protein [Planctomycetota bacterium]
MFNDIRVILHLRGPLAQDTLDRAYRLSLARYTRLTRRGPLSFYRNVLLDDARSAYVSLTVSLPNQPNSTTPAIRKDRRQPPKPLCDSRLSEVKILSSEPIHLKGRSINEIRHGCALDKTDQIRLEEAFCREVLYRLEGDLIRYTSRKQLLHIAAQSGLHLFRANLLMAQIVESVRQHKLYKPSKDEKKITRSKTQQNEKLVTHQKKSPARSPIERFLLALAVTVIILTDILIFATFLK